MLTQHDRDMSIKHTDIVPFLSCHPDLLSLTYVPPQEIRSPSDIATRVPCVFATTLHVCIDSARFLTGTAHVAMSRQQKHAAADSPP